MIDFSRIGFPSLVSPLSLNPLGAPSSPFGSLSLGASSFAQANPAMSLISQGFGTGRSNYSPFGTSGMYGSVGLGAPMLGGLTFAGPGPNFLNMNELFMQLWSATFGPKQSMPAGPAQQYAPPQAPPSADETGKAGKADTDKTEDAKGADKADGKEGAAKGDWKANAGKAFEGSGVRVAGTDETDGKKVVRLEPESGATPQKAKVARALQTLHRNGVKTALIGDESVPTMVYHKAGNAKKAVKKGDDGSALEQLKSFGKGVGKSLGVIKDDADAAPDTARKGGWVPNTAGVMRALKKQAPSAPSGGADVGAALEAPLKKIAAARYVRSNNKKPHTITLPVAKGEKPDVVAKQVVDALDEADKSMATQATGQQITVEFTGDKAEVEAAQKEFDEQFKKGSHKNLPPVVSVASVKRA